MAPSQKSDQKGKAWDSPILGGEHKESISALLASLASTVDSATFQGRSLQNPTVLGLTYYESHPQDGQGLSLSPRLRLQALGTRRLLLLRRCCSSDAGTYSCVVGTARSGPARLSVRGGYPEKPEYCFGRPYSSPTSREGAWRMCVLAPPRPPSRSRLRPRTRGVRAPRAPVR